MALGFILMGLAGIIGLISTVLYIMLLVKLFQNAGAGLGILGIFCGPFTYIWGWMKSRELGLKKLMVWLTLTLIISTLIYMAGSAVLLTSPEMQEQMQKMKEEGADFQSEFQKTIDEAAEQAKQEATAPTPSAPSEVGVGQ